MHVGRGQRPAVVEARVAPQVKDVGRRRRPLPGEREFGGGLAGGVEPHQRVEEQRQDAHRRGAGGEARVEVRGVGLEPDDERARVDGARPAQEAAASSAHAATRSLRSRS